ncbi:cell division protein FtsN [Marinomonas gallaica]|uniref:Cell division protein FtsN n=1 Tax=Marinomonas gallaica TaxID=1806667 RepID=A0A1C3JPH4_9GAMM|nr:SPOR domain-containing protein [Marinomonas gallaica]SBT16919.1 cell division protein FtsN [Marinomonas gallaica]SBT22130.1 cell division protein FtsN [Marinomonas gallaica]
MLDFMLLATQNNRSRKGATRKAPPPPPKRSLPWWLWLVVPALLASFVFVLVKLASVETQPSTTKVQTVAPAKPAPAKPKETVKAAPKAAEKPQSDKFEFYQLLQDSEVDTSHVDAYEYQPREEENFSYMIQAASFRSSADADRLRAKLILSGLTASIKASTSEDRGTWYRVVVGPFDTRSGESRAQDKLAEMGMNSYTYKIKKEP